jgi:ankyrin repeat protein
MAVVIATFRTLFEVGASPNVQNKLGRSPLHWAAALGQTDVLEALLSAADLQIDITNAKAETPLHWAVNWNRELAVRRLLETGADPTRVDQMGKSPGLMTSSSVIRTLLDESSPV